MCVSSLVVVRRFITANVAADEKSELPANIHDRIFFGNVERVFSRKKLIFLRDAQKRPDEGLRLSLISRDMGGE
jgi:hypothetical protein